MKSKNPSGTLSASRLQAKSRDKKQQAHRDHALKRLIFDETNVDDIPPASSNPGYVNDWNLPCFDLSWREENRIGSRLTQCAS